MKIRFTRHDPVAATLRWDRNMDVVPRVGDRLAFDDPESPFIVKAVTWYLDRKDDEPDVWINVR